MYMFGRKYRSEIATVDNGFPWVITVVAGTISRWFAGTLTLGEEVKIVGWSTFPGKYLIAECTISSEKASVVVQLLNCYPKSTTPSLFVILLGLSWIKYRI